MSRISVRSTFSNEPRFIVMVKKCVVTVFIFLEDRTSINMSTDVETQLFLFSLSWKHWTLYLL